MNQHERCHHLSVYSEAEACDLLVDLKQALIGVDDSSQDNEESS